MKTHLSVLICLMGSLLALPAPAQVWQEWVATYNGPAGNDHAWAIALDANGNVYVTGESSAGGGSSGVEDFATLKYNPMGQQQWLARYNGPASWYDIPYDIAVDLDGDVVVCGFGWFNTSRMADFLTIKYGSYGEQLWVSWYNGPASGADAAISLTIADDGDIYVTGSSDGSGTEKDFLTIKYDSNGAEQWIARYDSPYHAWDEARAIAIDEAENVFITGYSDEIRGPQTNYDCLTIKYDSNGVEQWVSRFNDPLNDNDVAYSIALDGAENIYVTGGTGNMTTGTSDFLTIKYNCYGAEQWFRRYDGPGNRDDAAWDIAIDLAGAVFIAGSSCGETWDYATIKYNPDGSQEWVARYDGPDNGTDMATSIATDRLGNIYVTGESNGSTYYDYATVKYNINGEELWAIRYNGPGLSWDHASELVVDMAGNVYVTGGSANNNYDFCTIKYTQIMPNQAPQINSYFPISADTIMIGSNVAFWASATDPDGDSLLWQWRYDSTVVATDSFCTITFNESGDHQVVCAVSDGELADSVVWNVTVVPLGITGENPVYPLSFSLYPSFPNPFNPTTVLIFDLPVASLVRLEVFDIKGQRVGVGFVPTRFPAGMHEITFDASGLPSGIYLCRLQAGEWSATQKLVLMK